MFRAEFRGSTPAMMGDEPPDPMGVHPLRSGAQAPQASRAPHRLSERLGRPPARRPTERPQPLGSVHPVRRAAAVRSVAPHRRQAARQQSRMQSAAPASARSAARPRNGSQGLNRPKGRGRGHHRDSHFSWNRTTTLPAPVTAASAPRPPTTRRAGRRLNPRSVWRTGGGSIERRPGLPAEGIDVSAGTSAGGQELLEELDHRPGRERSPFRPVPHEPDDPTAIAPQVVGDGGRERSEAGAI